MKKVIFIVLPLLLVAAAPAAAQPSANVVVRSTIHDADIGVAPTMHIRSDAVSGGTEDYENRPRYLESIIQGGGDWELDLGFFTKPSGRSAILGGFPPASGQFSQIHFITRCRDAGRHTQNILQLQLGASAPCGLTLEWKDLGDGFTYRLYLNENVSFTGHPGNGDVLVTCTAFTGGLCSRWRIRPELSDGNGVYSSVGTVVKLIPNKKGGPTQQVQGTGSFSFSFDLAKP